MLRRLLERPCTLALLVGCQFAFVAYFSLGGFRNLTSLFGRAAGPVFDYTRTHDVYANFSRLQPPAARLDADPAQPPPYCPERSPFLSEWRPGGRDPPPGGFGVSWGGSVSPPATGTGFWGWSPLGLHRPVSPVQSAR